jgi:hypothetical protein
LWSVLPRGLVDRAALPSSLGRATELRQEQQRLRIRSDLLDLPANVLAENTPDDLSRWYLLWARQQTAAVQYADYLQYRAGKTDAAYRQAGQRWESQKGQWATRLGTAVVTQQAEEQAGRVARPPVLLAGMTPTPIAPTRVAVDEALDTITVSLPQLDRGNFALRLLASLAALLAAGLVWRIRWKGGWGDYLASCPQLVGVLVGLAWWLWLTPSILGWVIVAFSLIAGVRPLPIAGNEDKTKRVKAGNLPLGNIARRG